MRGEGGPSCQVKTISVAVPILLYFTGSLSVCSSATTHFYSKTKTDRMAGLRVKRCNYKSACYFSNQCITQLGYWSFSERFSESGRQPWTLSATWEWRGALWAFCKGLPGTYLWKWNEINLQGTFKTNPLKQRSQPVFLTSIILGCVISKIKGCH